ncbi:MULTISPECIES: PLP-dependent aminotransferase family protein [Pelosinus]|uniref:Aminotransferase class I and II n=1 Tax=Pelosinus fermentans B4 TaxID=1149862 RepID=I8RDL6_9FIRM|nr:MULTISPECIES: aminotransferase class I/II-fold pyridoxal phosphate-dependent enzyme [Pelosinus]MDF2573000.1 transcriptional regulator, GntR family with aminotransferase domain containing protein [Sporomusa sp.]EIW17328.1 aminotransferase class I and II [Pelosinus fermentans B4]EIW23387.1 transcriptional regulator, GntR family with aminotransferase domain-containing protein [Pelosinus fermentans A11]OAM96498.1 transcriptional regulator, GntR family with aminotransferase domain containing prot
MKDIYQIITEDLEENIRLGRYKGREKLPSIRALSQTYHCSQSTVVKAYEIVKSKHLVYSVPQSGYYIVENLPRIEKMNTSVIDFSTGNPIIGDMQIPDLKHCLDRAVDSSNQYSIHRHLHGTDSLRSMIPKYLTDFQVFTRAKNIYINLGVQQALSILTQITFPNQKNVILIEQPTYGFCIRFLEHWGADVRGIRRSKQGVDLDELETLFKTEKIKFFYTVPRNHNPLGTAYGTRQRKAIAALADKYDVYIVEDDYCSDISLDHKYDPIYAYGDHFHHIYLKSFSKIIPWFRIGIVVLPTHLIPIFERHAMYSYYHSYFSASLVSQATLEIYIRNKLLEKYVTAIKKELAQRLECLASNLKKMEEYDVQYSGGESGFYAYLKLPHYINEGRFIADLQKHHVLVTPGNLYFLQNSYGEKGVRLSISRTNTHEIQHGFEIIYKRLAQYVRS